MVVNDTKKNNGYHSLLLKLFFTCLRGVAFFTNMVYILPLLVN